MATWRKAEKNKSREASGYTPQKASEVLEDCPATTPPPKQRPIKPRGGAATDTPSSSGSMQALRERSPRRDTTVDTEYSMVTSPEDERTAERVKALEDPFCGPWEGGG